MRCGGMRLHTTRGSLTKLGRCSLARAIRVNLARTPATFPASPRAWRPLAPAWRAQPNGRAAVLRLVGALLHVDAQLVHVLDILLHDRLVMQAHQPRSVRCRVRARRRSTAARRACTGASRRVSRRTREETKSNDGTVSIGSPCSAAPSACAAVFRSSSVSSIRRACDTWSRHLRQIRSGDGAPAPRYTPRCVDACISRRTSSDHGTRWSRAVTDGQFTSAKKACCLRSHSRERSAASYDLPVARRRRLMFLAEMRSSADLRSSMYRKSCAASERPCMYACDGSLNAARSRSSNG